MSFRSRLAEWARGLVHDLLVNHVAATPLVPRPVRWRVLRAFGMPVQPSWIGTYVYLGSRRIHIGEGCQLGRDTYIDGAARVVLGPNVTVGHRTTIASGAHELGPAERRCGPLAPAEIIIGAGAWVGANATICPGVTIGEGVVVGAGSVVVKDCEPHTLYAGNPARAVRPLED